jgi:hypothetical protein
LPPLTFDQESYTTNLSGDTKYFLTSPSLAVTKIIIENGVFSGQQSFRKGEEGSCETFSLGLGKSSFLRKRRNIVKKGGEFLQVDNGFIHTLRRENDEKDLC